MSSWRARCTPVVDAGAKKAGIVSNVILLITKIFVMHKT